MFGQRPVFVAILNSRIKASTTLIRKSNCLRLSWKSATITFMKIFVRTADGFIKQVLPEDMIQDMLPGSAH